MVAEPNSAWRGRWLWVILGVVVADRAIKYAVERFTSDGFRRELVPNAVVLVHSVNPGIAFGLLSDSASRAVSLLLIGSSVAVVSLLVWLSDKRTRRQFPESGWSGSDCRRRDRESARSFAAWWRNRFSRAARRFVCMAGIQPRGCSDHDWCAAGHSRAAPCRAAPETRTRVGPSCLAHLLKSRRTFPMEFRSPLPPWSGASLLPQTTRDSASISI